MIRIQEGDEFSCKFGKYKHSDMIGLQFGTKLASNTGRGFVYLLYPTPELWTMILPHRTQILYVADISLIMNFLNLKPGMSMIESGTGSGSFTHSIARTIAPTGHLYTFEYHQERANVAAKEFAEHGLSHLVTLQCRDVCKEGFDIEDKVDAGTPSTLFQRTRRENLVRSKLKKKKMLSIPLLVFLDLPAPWEAVASAKKAFRQNKMGKICTFSPCIEQISKTVTALNDLGFADIQMYECLVRFQELRVLPTWTIDEALEMECVAEKKRKRGLPRVVREALKKEQQDREENESTHDDDDHSEISTKRRHGESDTQPASSGAEGTQPSPVAINPTVSIECETETSFLAQNHAAPRETIEAKSVLTTRLPAEQRGHTSYLLFATFTPTVQ